MTLFLILKMQNVSYSTDTFIIIFTSYTYEVNEISRRMFVGEHSTFVLNAEYLWWVEWDIFQLRDSGVLHSLAPTVAQLFLHVTLGYSGWLTGHVPFSCCSKTQHVSSHQHACPGTHADYAGTPRLEFFPSLYSDDKLAL